MAKLTGKIALVTGGNSGMGLSNPLELVRSGRACKVVITGRRARKI